MFVDSCYFIVVVVDGGGGDVCVCVIHFLDLLVCAYSGFTCVVNLLGLFSFLLAPINICCLK